MNNSVKFAWLWLVFVNLVMVYCGYHTHVWIKTIPDFYGVIAVISDVLLFLEALFLTIKAIQIIDEY